MDYVEGEELLEVFAQEDLCAVIVESLRKLDGGKELVYIALGVTNEEFEARFNDLRSRMQLVNRMPGHNTRRRFTDLLKSPGYENREEQSENCSTRDKKTTSVWRLES
jgi:hypothetical protein